MRLQWKGRNYRPVGNYVRVRKPDISELMKPLSEKKGLGSAILTGEFISGIGDAYGPDVPTVSPSPTETSQPTPTPSITPTFTSTPTVTPSSTPFPFVQPSLWFDASDSTTMNLILSGGTTYISQITSKGTESWTLTGQTTNRYPIYSASTSFPGSPNIIRFTPNATTTSRQGLVAFDRPVLTHTGSTIFVVWNQPAGSASFINQVYSGNTNGTLAVSGTNIFDRLQFASIASNIANTNIYPQTSIQSVSIPAPISATSLNNKYLMKAVLSANPGFGSWELNQSGETSTVLFTGTTITPQWNAFNLGFVTSSSGQIFATNTNIELAEMMVYNRELSSDEQEAVELYLRDKWRYDEWASPVPTPTQTSSPTPSITPSVSPTVTMTPTNTITASPTPSSTPPPYSPSGLTNLQYWFMSPSGSSVSSWTNYGLLGGAVSQGTAAFQPAKITNDTFGTGFTGTSMSFANQDTMSAFFTNTTFTAKTFFAVFRVAGRSIQGSFLSLRSSNTDSNATRVFVYDMYASPTTHNTQSVPGVSTFTATTGSFIFASSGSSNSFIGELNGVLGSSGTTAFSQTSGQFFEFGYNPGSANSNDVRIFEFIGYNRELTSSEYADTLNYLKNKYNFYP